MKRLVTFGIAVGLIWSAFSCSESKFVEPEEPTFVVSGMIYSITCSWFDAERPYSEISDQPATITFENIDNDSLYEASTDDESRYSLRLPNGSYLVQTYSYHWRPIGRDTVSIHNDTLIDRTGMVSWFYPDTITVGFYYPLGDSLPESEELDLIRSLDAETGGSLDIDNGRRHTFDPDDPDWLVIQNEYYIPIAPELHPWVIEDLLLSAIDSDTITYPTEMFAHLGYMICFGAQESVSGRDE